MSVEERVKEIIAEILKVDVIIVIPKAKLEDLGADSMDYLQLRFVLNREFGINLSLKDMEEMPRVEDYIEEVKEVEL